MSTMPVRMLDSLTRNPLTGPCADMDGQYCLKVPHSRYGGRYGTGVEDPADLWVRGRKS